MNLRYYYILFISIAIAFLFNSCGIVISTLIPFKDLPIPNGKYIVGTKILTWKDDARLEWFTDLENDYRKIVIQIWYPCINSQNNIAPYMDKWDQRINAISEQIEVNPLLIRSIKDVSTNSFLNEKILIRDTPYPLIIFSHGLGGMRMQNTIQMETLASNGYIAIAIDHAYDANITIFSDGSIAEYKSGYEGELSIQEFWDLRLPQITTRAADISFLLNKIESLQKEKIDFWNAIDINKIGIIGHSFGGATGIVSSYKDKRIDACIALDGWIVPIESSIINNGMDVPFLYIGREKWDTVLNYDKLDSLIDNSKSYAEKIILQNTKHFDYSDTPQFTSLSKIIGVAGKMPAETIKDTINNSMMKFFNKYLININEL